MKLATQNGLFQGIRTGAPRLLVVGGYCAQAVALFARMTVQPSMPLKQLINESIVYYKENGNWATDEFIYSVNLHTEQASIQNWKENLYNLIPVFSPTWQAKIGYTGTADSRYLRNGFVLNTHKLFLSVNDSNISVSISNNTIGGAGAGCDLGVQDVYSKFNFWSRYSTGQTVAQLGTRASSSCWQGTSSGSSGNWVANKISNSLIKTYRNNLYFGEGIADSYSALANLEMYFMGLNLNGGIGYLNSGRVYRGFSIGKGLSETKALRKSWIMQYFNDNVGGTF